MGIISSFYPYKTHISYTFCRQPIYSQYHGHNYSYLMLTNFIGHSYMCDFVAKMLPIKSSIWVVFWVLCVCCGLECTLMELYMAPRTFTYHLLSITLTYHHLSLTVYHPNVSSPIRLSATIYSPLPTPYLPITNHINPQPSPTLLSAISNPPPDPLPTQ